METCTCAHHENTAAGRLPSPIEVRSQSLLRWISPYELEAVREAVMRGRLPADFQAKLDRMRSGELSHHFIEQNCRLFVTLLVAAEQGSFRGTTLTQREALLRVLAYVRKDEDAIPDYKPGGLTDDQRELRAVTVELASLIQEFKSWRLRHQVPVMWPAQW